MNGQSGSSVNGENNKMKVDVGEVFVGTLAVFDLEIRLT
jgi:hypothetical protein